MHIVKINLQIFYIRIKKTTFFEIFQVFTVVLNLILIVLS